MNDREEWRERVRDIRATSTMMMMMMMMMIKYTRSNSTVKPSANADAENSKK